METRWIEAESLHDDHNSTTEEEDDAHATLTDLFADPDPYETFSYAWTVPGATDPYEIQLTVTGHKAENGQTLHSTGLTVWRASSLLADWLVQQQRTSVAANDDVPSSSSIQWPRSWHTTTVLELGAGLGVPGMLCHKLGAAVVLLTDGDTDTLANLRANVQRNCTDVTTVHTEPSHASLPIAGESAQSTPWSPLDLTSPPRRIVTCQQLVWGNATHVEQVRTFGCVKDARGWDVILGSDIIYVDHVVAPLFQTVHQLLRRDTGLFVLAYCRRNVSITRVLQMAHDEGLVLRGAPESHKDGIYIFTVASDDAA